jgi:hypothetical protein
MKCQKFGCGSHAVETESAHLAREVELDGLDADVARAGVHFVIERIYESD